MSPKTYYEILGVSATASKEDIKKAYYKLALQHHPDKTNTPQSVEFFTKISEAYQVLSDPVRRKQYDQFGTLQHDAAVANPRDLLKKELGIANLDSIIGEAAFIDLFVDIATETEDKKESLRVDRTIYKQKQRERVVFVFNVLQKKTDLYTAGGYTEDDLRQYIQQETEILCCDDVSRHVLHMAGEIYNNQATQFLKKSFIAFPQYIYYSTKDAFQTMKYANAAFCSFFKLIRHFKRSKDGKEDIEKMQATGLEALHNFFAYETNKVLKKASSMLLYDKTVSRERCKKRAAALKIISEVYQQTDTAGTATDTIHP